MTVLAASVPTFRVGLDASPARELQKEVEVEAPSAPAGLGSARRAQLDADEPVAAAEAFCARRINAKMASLATSVGTPPQLRKALKLHLEQELELNPQGGQAEVLGNPGAADGVPAAAALKTSAPPPEAADRPAPAVAGVAPGAAAPAAPSQDNGIGPDTPRVEATVPELGEGAAGADGVSPAAGSPTADRSPANMTRGTSPAGGAASGARPSAAAGAPAHTPAVGARGPEGLAAGGDTLTTLASPPCATAPPGHAGAQPRTVVGGRGGPQAAASEAAAGRGTRH